MPMRCWASIREPTIMMKRWVAEVAVVVVAAVVDVLKKMIVPSFRMRREWTLDSISPTSTKCSTVIKLLERLNAVAVDEETEALIVAVEAVVIEKPIVVVVEEVTESLSAVVAEEVTEATENPTVVVAAEVTESLSAVVAEEVTEATENPIAVVVEKVTEVAEVAVEAAAVEAVVRAEKKEKRNSRMNNLLNNRPTRKHRRLLVTAVATLLPASKLMNKSLLLATRSCTSS